MKLDSIIALDHNYKYENNEILKPTIIETNMASEVHTIGMHLDLIPGDGKSFHGVADTPKDCIEEKKCTNPSTTALMDFINKVAPTENPEVAQVVKGFELKVNVQLPVGFATDLTVINILNQDKNVDISNYRLHGEEKESVAEFLETSTILIKGSIMQDEPDYDLILQIKHPLLKTKKVKVKVRKGVTTFLSTGLSQR